MRVLSLFLCATALSMACFIQPVSAQATNGLGDPHPKHPEYFLFREVKGAFIEPAFRDGNRIWISDATGKPVTNATQYKVEIKGKCPVAGRMTVELTPTELPANKSHGTVHTDWRAYLSADREAGQAYQVNVLRGNAGITMAKDSEKPCRWICRLYLKPFDQKAFDAWLADRKQAAPAWQTWHSKKFSVAFQYPSDWKLNNAAGENGAIVYKPGFGQFEMKLVKLPPQFTTAMWTAHVSQKLNATTDGLQVQETLPDRTINGRNWQAVRYKHDKKTGSFIGYHLASNGVGLWVLTEQVQPGSAAVLDKILGTLQLGVKAEAAAPPVATVAPVPATAAPPQQVNGPKVWESKKYNVKFQYPPAPWKLNSQGDNGAIVYRPGWGQFEMKLVALPAGFTTAQWAAHVARKLSSSAGGLSDAKQIGTMDINGKQWIVQQYTHATKHGTFRGYCLADNQVGIWVMCQSETQAGEQFLTAMLKSLHRP